MTNSEHGLLPALQKALKNATYPMDYNQLYALPEVKTHAMTPLRVSDALGKLWRKGYITRQYKPDAHLQGGRWLYQWREGAAQAYDDLEPQAECMTVEIGGMVVTLSVSVRRKNTGFDYVDAVVGC